MSKDVNIGVEAIKAFTGKVGQAAVGFFGTILFARALGPTGLGGFYLLLTLVKFADRPVHGFAHAVKKRYSEYDAPEAEIFGAMVVVGGGYVLVGGGVAFLLREQLRRLTAVPDAWLLFTLLLATATAFHTVQKVLAGQGLVGVQTWNDTLRSLLTLPLQLAIVVQTAVVGDASLAEVFVSESQRCVVQTGAGSAGMGYGLAAATVLVLPVGLYYLRLRPAIPSWETLRSVGAFARYSVFSSVVGKTQGRFDILLLGGFVGTAAIGAYEVADRLTVPALFLAGVATTGLMTKVSNRHSQGESFLPDVANVLSYASLFAVPLFFGAVAIGDAVVRTFYGGEFTGAAAVLVGLAAGQLITTQHTVYRTTLDGIDEPRVGLRINAAALVVNVALGLLLVVPFGVLGVVAATVVADAVKLVVSVRALRARVGDVTVAPRPFQAQLLSGAVMGVVTAGARRLFPVGSLTDLLVLVGLGGTVYFGCLVVVSTHFRETVVGVVGDTLRDLRSE
jgi:O-antigen/teichoic acid export membrane protein